MKILVTGASGFIGSHLVDRMVAEGHEVTVLVRSVSRLQWIAPDRIRIITGRLDDPDAVRQAVAGQDIVFNSAGSVRALHESGFDPANVDGPRVLAEAVLEKNPGLRRLVHVSSLEAGGPSNGGAPRTEADPSQPVSAYGWSKLRGEEALRMHADRFPLVIVRPPVVYGPRDIGLWEFFKSVRRGLKFTIGSGERFASTIHVDDIVEALRLCALEPVASDSLYYVEDREPPLSWLQLQDRIAEALGCRRCVPVRAPLWLFYAICMGGQGYQRLTRRQLWVNRTRYRSLSQQAWLCSGHKIEKELGFRPRVTLTEGLAATAAWYRDMGWL